MNLSLELFGDTTLQTNAVAASRTAAGEYPVNFDEFGDRVTLDFSAIASQAATPTQAAVIEVWASATSLDVSGTGTLLGRITLPQTAIASATGYYAGLDIANPGGELYVVFTTQAGLDGAAPVTLSFRGLLLNVAGPDGDACDVTTTPLVRMRAGAKRLADKKDDLSVTDDEWDGFVNDGVEDLWRKFVQATGDAFLSQHDFTLVGGAGGNTFDVTTIPAADFRRVRFLEVDPDTTGRRRIRPFPFAEKDAGAGGRFSVLPPWDERRRYRRMGSVVRVEPYEQAAGNYRLYYVPKPAKLAVACDALPTELDEFSEYPQVFAAMKALGIEESDPGYLPTRLAELRADVAALKGDREEDADSNVLADVEDDGGPGSMW